MQIATTEPLATAIAEDILAGQVRSSMPPNSEVTEEQIQAMAKMQSMMMLTSLVQQGMLTNIDGQISSAIKLENGEITVNGSPIPLGAPMP